MPHDGDCAPAPFDRADAPCHSGATFCVDNEARKTMSKPEWGAKRQCLSCGVRFYDLNRDPITCPDCGATFEVEVLTRARRLRPAPRAAVKAAVVVEDVEDIDDVEEGEDDADAVVLDDEEDDETVAPPVAADDDEDEEDDVLLEDDEDDEVVLDVIEVDDEKPRHE